MAFITTAQYIKNFNNENNYTCISKWMHDHPTALKVAQITAVILGTAILATIPLSLPAIGAAAVAVIASVGALALISSVASWIFTQYVTCKKHEITAHIFEDSSKKKCEGGRLYYRGNIPILELDESGKKAGYAHGYLLGSNICKLKRNFDVILHTIMRHQRANNLPRTLEEIKKQLPDHLKEELSGLSEGFNKWAEESGNSMRLSEKDLLLMHLIPDSKHFIPKEIEDDLTGTPACTTMLYRSKQEGLVFGRNMDWCPFGDGGANSVVIVWKNKGVALLGTPGLIGAVTGWNRDQLTLAMNVCPGKSTEVRGIPAIFYNRLILENAKTLEEAQKFSQGNRPLGPYHLTIGDKNGDGACFSFYQEKQNNKEMDHIRYAENDKPLLVVNWQYPLCQGGSFNSAGRTALLNKYFANASRQIAPGSLKRRKLVKNALKLNPLVNSWITMHSLLIQPQRGIVEMGWDNGYAASTPKQKLKMRSVFEAVNDSHSRLIQ